MSQGANARYQYATAARLAIVGLRRSRLGEVAAIGLRIANLVLKPQPRTMVPGQRSTMRGLPSAHRAVRNAGWTTYRAAATLLKVVLRLVPTDPMMAMATTTIIAAISAYSIAVTPDSSLISFVNSVRNWILLSLDIYPRRLQSNI